MIYKEWYMLFYENNIRRINKMKKKDGIDKSKVINNLYSEREKFLLIGLTGRTGAGCTTVSTIFAL